MVRMKERGCKRDNNADRIRTNIPSFALIVTGDLASEHPKQVAQHADLYALAANASVRNITEVLSKASHLKQASKPGCRKEKN
jgi:hypothetical protein